MCKSVNAPKDYYRNVKGLTQKSTTSERSKLWTFGEDVDTATMKSFKSGKYVF